MACLTRISKIIICRSPIKEPLLLFVGSVFWEYHNSNNRKENLFFLFFIQALKVPSMNLVRKQSFPERCVCVVFVLVYDIPIRWSILGWLRQVKIRLVWIHQFGKFKLWAKFLNLKSGSLKLKTDKIFRPQPKSCSLLRQKVLCWRRRELKMSAEVESFYQFSTLSGFSFEKFPSDKN